MGGKTNAHEVSVAKPESKTLLGIPRYNKTIMLKWIIEKRDGKGSSWVICFRTETGGGFLLN
jgi:hypothetical protein